MDRKDVLKARISDDTFSPGSFSREHFAWGKNNPYWVRILISPYKDFLIFLPVAQ
jgi:hypothetical protein